MECSVENSRELVLSWFKGDNELTRTSGSLLSACLSLPLEIQPEERDDYSCVAENPVDRKAAKLPSEDTCVKVEGRVMPKQCRRPVETADHVTVPLWK